MKRLITLAVTFAALALAGSAAAALTPWTFVDTGVTCAVSSSFSDGALHLSKPCPTPTSASAGATITGVAGQTFGSGSFTLATASQCQGGSPRFNVVTTNGTTQTTFFLGCNNVTPTVNGDGTATYTFDAASIAAGGNQVPVPTGTISAVDVLIDVQGTADLSNITFNGVAQVPAPAASPTKKSDCKKGGWKSFTDPKFRNQGQCVSWVNHHNGHGKGKPAGKK